VTLCEEKLKTKLPEYDVVTVGGVAFSLAGHIPQPGQKLNYDGGSFVVESVDGQRIAKLRLLLEEQKLQQQADA